MDNLQKNIEKQQQYQQGLKVGEKQIVISSADITSEQWFWDMAVMS